MVTATWTDDGRIMVPARYRRPCRYRAFVPDPVAGIDLTLPGALAGVVSDAEAAVRSLNANAAPGLAPLARLLLRTESIASSKVEGLQVDTRTLARAEAKSDIGRSIGTTTREILANIDAMQLAVEEASSVERMGPDGIVAIHRVLMAQATNPDLAGKIRVEQNWIGGNDYNPCGADFVPPPPDEVVRLLDDLCELVNAEDLPPLVQAAVVHGQFETIHPFLDGNGRTGRALIHVVLRRRGLAPSYVPPVSVVLARDKERYISGLTDYREGRMAQWVETFAVACARAANLAQRYLVEVGDLQERWRAQLRAEVNPRADAAAWSVIDALSGHPVVTVPVAVAATGRSKPAVNQAMKQLSAAGVLEPVSASPRNRAWEAHGLLDLLAGLDAGR
ncbi:MAG: Fic family protein [Acidimicrobiia bacterium]